MENKILINNNGKILLDPNGKVIIYGGSFPSASDYLCFTANEANSTVELLKYWNPSISNTAYSRDGNTWTEFTPSMTAGTNVITLNNIGDKVYFRNDITGNFTTSNYLHFKMSGSISASGNMNSMYSSTNFNKLTTLTYKYCYKSMFDSCTSLTAAPELPATTLAEGCYNDMFKWCSSLTIAPILPATTLAPRCYSSMFESCIKLTAAPALSATALAERCYYYMFNGCTALTQAPELPATTLAVECYDAMFYGCSALVQAPALPAITLANWCYADMFGGCSSLTTVPMLPATELKLSCYGGMFLNCTSLQVSSNQTAQAQYQWKIPASGTFTNTTDYNQAQMFKNCAGTRSNDAMPGESGQTYTYYTQNKPIGPSTITPIFTNVTGQPSSSVVVQSGGSQSFTVSADGTSYKLPTKITVAGTEVTAGSSTEISGKCTVLFTRSGDTSGSIAFSNVTDDVAFSVVGEAVASYPVKGQLITMNLGNATPAAGTNNQYRVLSINGSVAEVVAMYDMPDIEFNSDGENTYNGGELDTYLNTIFYDSLSSTAKSAIVDKNITQYQYAFNSSVYNETTHASYADYSTKASKAVVGSRHVYALDVEDIETYFNNTFSTANIWTLFWNTTAKSSTVTYPWLRSAHADRSSYAWTVDDFYGDVNFNNVGRDCAARPALTIDLSKISWS